MEDVEWIQRQYFQAVVMKDFDWGKLKSGSKPIEQHCILNATYLHPFSKKFPRSSSYNLAFLKKLLSIYEERECEICDELYPCIGNIISKSTGQEDSCFKSYFLPCRKVITLRESTKFLSDGTTGLNTWQAGLFLSNWLVHNKGIIHGKNVLELGCGVGLAGMIAMHCCHPRTYIFTDVHEKVLQRLQENLRINGFVELDKTANSEDSLAELNENRKETHFKNTSRGTLLDNNIKDFSEVGETLTLGCYKKCPSNEDNQVTSSLTSSGYCESCDETSCDKEDYSLAKVCQLDWQTSTVCPEQHDSPGIILAADVIFDPVVIDPLVNVIKTFLSAGNQKKAFIASTVRNTDTYDKFLSGLERHGIKQSLIVDNPEKKFFLYKTVSKIELLQLELKV